MLRASPARVLAYVPQLAPDLAQRAVSTRMRLSPVPLDMSSVCAQADVLVCNAGSGTVCTALQAGLPVLLLPMHAEQLLFSIRVAETGAGLWLLESDVREKAAKALARLLREPGFTASAQALAVKYAGDATRDVAGEVAARVRQLRSGRPPEATTAADDAARGARPP